MSYRYDKQQQKKKWYFFGIVVLIISFFTPFFSWVFSIVERPLLINWENNQTVANSSDNIIQALFARTKVVQENKDLKRENEKLKIDNLRSQFLAQQLDTLLNNEDSFQKVATIVSRDGLGYRDSLVISRGAKDGVAISQNIISDSGVLLGYVSEVYSSTARVTLYSKNQEKVLGILYPHNFDLDVIGYGNGSFFINAQREINVQKGDILYSQKEPGRIIAIVRDVVFDARDPFKKVYLSYPINIDSVRNVYIQEVPAETIELTHNAQDDVEESEDTLNQNQE